VRLLRKNSLSARCAAISRRMRRRSDDDAFFSMPRHYGSAALIALPITAGMPRPFLSSPGRAILCGGTELMDDFKVAFLYAAGHATAPSLMPGTNVLPIDAAGHWLAARLQ
jgi:hypothetical protein